MTANQLRALGRVIELVGFGAATEIVTIPASLDWCWYVDGHKAFTGPLLHCNQLDSAYNVSAHTLPS